MVYLFFKKINIDVNYICFLNYAINFFLKLISFNVNPNYIDGINAWEKRLMFLSLIKNMTLLSLYVHLIITWKIKFLDGSNLMVASNLTCISHILFLFWPERQHEPSTLYSWLYDTCFDINPSINWLQLIYIYFNYP